MGLVVRFPLERAQAMPPSGVEGESASIIVLPVIRIERGNLPRTEQDKPRAAKPRSRASSRPRRRVRRPA